MWTVSPKQIHLSFVKQITLETVTYLVTILLRIFICHGIISYVLLISCQHFLSAFPVYVVIFLVYVSQRTCNFNALQADPCTVRFWLLFYFWIPANMHPCWAGSYCENNTFLAWDTHANQCNGFTFYVLPFDLTVDKLGKALFQTVRAAIQPPAMAGTKVHFSLLEASFFLSCIQ